MNEYYICRYIEYKIVARDYNALYILANPLLISF